MPEDNPKNLETKINQETPLVPLFGAKPWRDTDLYSIDGNDYYVSEHHPFAAKVVNTYLKFVRWLCQVEYKKE